MAFTPEILTSDVKAVGNFASDDLSVHIATTDIYMESVFTDVSMGDALYRLIGIYLSAHFAYLQEGQIKTDKTDILSETFNMTSGLALNSTTHGQQAIALDPTGTLSNLNAQASNTTAKKGKASINIC